VLDRSVAWLDGELRPFDGIRIALDDPAILAGLGTFETLAVRDGAVLEIDEHLARMQHAARQLAVPLPEATVLRGALLEVAGKQGHPFGWLKLLATRSGRRAVFGGSMDPEAEGRPATAVLLPWMKSLRDPLSGLKTLNYAANTLGIEWAQARGADEGLWRNSRGHLAEGCASNVFIVRRRALYTAREGEGVLPGVVRDLVLQAARRAGLSVHEGRVRMVRLERADEAFLTSSLRAVRPLIAFDGRPIGDGRPGPITAMLGHAVEALRRRTSTADTAT
jgi:branched-chain amino acid aminotransferase